VIEVIKVFKYIFELHSLSESVKEDRFDFIVIQVLDFLVIIE